MYKQEKGDIGRIVDNVLFLEFNILLRRVKNLPIVLIMAGGIGERFWPASKKERPKQFLPLISSEPMICETITRAKDTVAINDIHIVTVEQQKELLKDCAMEFPIENVILEPMGKNTAPCIALAVFDLLKKYSEDEVIAVLPADHHISKQGDFSKLLTYSYQLASETEEFVTFGITPNRPETGYGYIEIGDKTATHAHQGIRFVEKPHKELAQTYLDSGKYLWNSGMFVFKISSFLKELEKNQPEIYYAVKEISQTEDQEFRKEKYAQLPSISIDYAIMEQLQNFLVVPADIGWDDVGSWRALETTKGKDQQGNVVIGDCILKDVKDSIIFNEGKLIAVVGVDNLVVVNTEDAILVIPKDRLENIREIVAEIRTRK